MRIDDSLLLMATLLTSILMATGPILSIWFRSPAPLLVPRKPQLGPRLIWAMMVLCLLFWGAVIQFTLDLLTFSLSSRYRFQPSVISRFSLSSLPYRAYPLSCCLLD